MDNNYDEAFVLYDNDTDRFYCGISIWDKQLRKAKFYHSYHYAEKQQDLCFNDVDIYRVQIKVCDKIEED